MSNKLEDCPNVLCKSENITETTAGKMIKIYCNNCFGSMYSEVLKKVAKE